MKCLIKYLLIFLSLGLIFNVNAEAKLSKNPKWSDGIFCIYEMEHDKKLYFFYSEYNDCSDRINKKTARYIVTKENHWKLYKSLHFRLLSNRENNNYFHFPLPKKLYKKIQNEVVLQNYEKMLSNNSILENNQKTKSLSKTDNQIDLTEQQKIEIEQIKEMFSIGALTKDEYDAAIKRVLN